MTDVVHSARVAVAIAGTNANLSRYCDRWKIAGGAVGQGYVRRYSDADLCALHVARVLTPGREAAGQPAVCALRDRAVRAVIACPRRFVAATPARAVTFDHAEQAPPIVRMLGGDVTIVDLAKGPAVVVEALARLTVHGPSPPLRTVPA